MASTGDWVLLVFTAPWAAFSWLLGVLSMVFWLAHRPWPVGAGILTLEIRPWLARWWRYSTTIGRCIWWQPERIDRKADLDERLERHERVHVRQNEDLMVLSFIVGLAVAIGHWWFGRWSTGAWWWFGLWVSGGLWQVPNFLTAILRYGWRGVYRDSEHERSAYAQTDLWPDGESWWQHRDHRRQYQDKPF